MSLEPYEAPRGIDDLVEAEPVDVTRRPVIPRALPVIHATVVHAQDAVGRGGHAAAYHGARLPVYFVRLAGRAPVGAWRILVAIVCWVLDVEGRRVRASMSGAQAGGAPEASAYLRVSAAHRDAMKLRAIALAVGAVVVAATIALAFAQWGAWAWLWLIPTVALLGWAGRTEATMHVGQAVHDAGPPRLSSTLVVDALGSLGIGELNKALRDDPRAVRFVSPICRDGAGWRADLDLPAGVTAAEVVERRARFASGLRRPESSVWPSPGNDHAGRLTLYVRDRPMDASRPVTWPLRESGTASYFEPLPVGVDERGRPVTLTLAGASCVAGGVPRSGKTVGVRVLALAAALDPLVELHIVDGKAGADWLPFEPIAQFLSVEDDELALARVVDDLRAVQGDMRRRYSSLRALPRERCPGGKVTADLAADRRMRLHPILYVIDESQIVLSGPGGKDAAGIVEDLIRRGPAAGITLILATQRPAKDSIPTGASANATLRLAWRTMDHLSSDVILGSGVGTAGYRSNTFTRSDAGLSWVLADGDDPSLCRWAYLDGDDAADVIARARAARERLGLLPTAIDDAPAADVLADALTLWPSTRARLRWEEIADLLTEAGHDLTPEAVSAAFRGRGVPTVQVARRENGAQTNRAGATRDAVAQAVAAR